MADDTGFTSLYFGFASNLSPRTLKQRCPGSMFVGLAKLTGWKFIINETGFSNMIKTGNSSDVVYGTLSFLTHRDEAALDMSEEVPDLNQKVRIKVEQVLTSSQQNDPAWAACSGRELEALTYIDEERKSSGKIRPEFVVMMRKAVADGKQCGVPEEYFREFIEDWLPTHEEISQDFPIMMIRTTQVDKEDIYQAPQELRQLAESKKS